MSIRRHGSHGTTIKCDRPSCPVRITTGQVTKKAIRAYVATLGWVRDRNRDLCESDGVEIRKAAAVRRARRDEMRTMTWEQRREERNKQR